MSYPQRNNSFQNRKNKNLLIYFVIVVVLIFIFSFSSTRAILFKTGYPFWSLKNYIVSTITNDANLFRSKSSLLKENQDFKKQIEDNKNILLMNDILVKENDELKSILNRKAGSKKVLLGVVLVKPFLSFYDTLILDIGKNDGVSLGDRVVAGDNVPIGYISEVYVDSSKAVLYSSSGEKTKVFIGENNIEKEAVGIGAGNFKVEVSRAIDVKEGDTIILPSISPNVFAVVEKIEFKEADALQTIYFKSPINIEELKWVEIFLGVKDKNQ